MMRFGCGAHMLRGNNKPAKDHVDPVCHMKVDQNQGYGMMHHGTLYRFFSYQCMDKFEKEPEKYLSNQKEGE